MMRKGPSLFHNKTGGAARNERQQGSDWQTSFWMRTRKAAH